MNPSCDYSFSEIVVVGTGDKLFPLDPKLHSYMRKQHNILLEVQATVSCICLFGTKMLQIESQTHSH